MNRIEAFAFCVVGNLDSIEPHVLPFHFQSHSGIVNDCQESYTGRGRGSLNRKVELAAPVVNPFGRLVTFRFLKVSRELILWEGLYSLPGWERARKLLLRRSGSPSGRSVSTLTCASSQIGVALASRAVPFRVRLSLRPRRSDGSAVTLTRPRRSSGLSAAVKVVRSMASSEATGPMPGGSGRFNDISKENWPFVSPTGRNSSSKYLASARAALCTCRQRQQSRTRSVISKGTAGTLDTILIC
jgi:hypothetical protein